MLAVLDWAFKIEPDSGCYLDFYDLAEWIL